MINANLGLRKRERVVIAFHILRCTPKPRKPACCGRQPIHFHYPKWNTPSSKNVLYLSNFACSNPYFIDKLFRFFAFFLQLLQFFVRFWLIRVEWDSATNQQRRKAKMNEFIQYNSTKLKTINLKNKRWQKGEAKKKSRECLQTNIAGGWKAGEKQKKETS